MTEHSTKFITGKKLFGLTGIAALVTLTVSFVAQETSEQIAANQLEYEMRAIAAVLPPDQYDNRPPQALRNITDGSTGQQLNAYMAYQGSTAIAAAIEITAQDGYVGPIRLLAGINADGQLLAVRVIKHSETPGLGDRIEYAKSDWLEQFVGLSAGQALTLSRDGGDVDHITGATITSRAATHAIRDSMLMVQRNKAALFADRDSEDH